MLESEQSVQSSGNEGIDREQSDTIRKSTKCSAQAKESAAGVIDKMVNIRDSCDVMFEWFHLHKSKQIKKARELKADSDCGKRTLKPIFMCYEGECLSGFSTEEPEASPDATSPRLTQRLLKLVSNNF